MFYFPLPSEESEFWYLEELLFVKQRKTFALRIMASDVTAGSLN